MRARCKITRHDKSDRHRVAVARHDEQLGVDAEEVNPDASFVEDLGADSLDTVELIMAFEEEFGVEISDDEAEKIMTVGQLIDYVKAHLAAVKTGA